MEFPKRTDAEQIAETFGIVLGAASYSGHVSDERLHAAVEKMACVLSATAADADDAAAASLCFSAAIEAGRNAAGDGKIDLDAAEHALAEIEEDLDAAGLSLK
jgi:hypothetical protein